MKPKSVDRPWPLIPVFVFATLAWFVLAGVMDMRSREQNQALEGRVHDLWGAPHQQSAPTVIYGWMEKYTARRPLEDDEGNAVLDGRGQPVVEEVEMERLMRRELVLTRTRLAVDLSLDQRRKGLMWFPLYDVSFAGDWSFEVPEPDPEGEDWLELSFDFPDPTAVYDDFAFGVGSTDITQEVQPREGRVVHRLPVPAVDELGFTVSYSSRGMSQWRYDPLDGVGRLSDFELDMKTDFGAIDFPSFTLSPSERTRDGEGWALAWRFSQVVTGHGMGMVMPERIQPGPLAARMSASAPISLGLFMLWLYVLGVVKGVRMHWINHLLLAASFFSFHLLFGYSADHLSVGWAFGLCSVVSMFLVVSYLRLVVGPRFALVEAGLAQLLYLVGFSLAHFWSGFTGLTITVMGIVTLCALMQLTGGIRWHDVFASTEWEPEGGNTASDAS